MGTLQILGMGGYESAKCQKIHIKKGFHIKKIIIIKKRLDRGEEQFKVIQMRGGKEEKMTKRSTKRK